jgi:hypothetical protein
VVCHGLLHTTISTKQFPFDGLHLLEMLISPWLFIAWMIVFMGGVYFEAIRACVIRDRRPANDRWMQYLTGLKGLPVYGIPGASRGLHSHPFTNGRQLSDRVSLLL